MASSSSPKLSPSHDDSDCGDRDVYNYSTDEEELEYDEDGTREMTQMSQYLRAFEKTQGFDIPSFPDFYACGRIVCITGNRLYTEPEIRKCAEVAINHYNKQNGTSFEFVKIVKANNQAAMGILYYLTFEVKQMGIPPDAPTPTTTLFQARVLSGFSDDDIEVELCRPKLST